MTLTQLGAFVLVARLGSVKEAARALNVSGPAVSQALTALRQHMGDPLLVRGPGGMTLTEGGARLLPIASQMVVLGAEAEGAVRAARGAPETLRVVAVPAVAEFVATPLLDAFAARSPREVEGGAGCRGRTGDGRPAAQPPRRHHRPPAPTHHHSTELRAPSARTWRTTRAAWSASPSSGPGSSPSARPPSRTRCGWSARPGPTRPARRPGRCAA